MMQNSKRVNELSELYIPDNRWNSVIKKQDEFPLIDKKEQPNFFQQEPDETQRIRLRSLLEEKSNLAHMNQIVVSSKDKPVIGTQALDTCIGLLFYNRKTKQGIVVHISPDFTAPVTNNVLSILLQSSSVDAEEWEYIIVDGYRNMERKDTQRSNYIMEQIDIFKLKHPNIKLSGLQIKNSDVKLHEETLSYEFAFETLTGQFVTKELFYDPLDYLKGRKR